MGSSAFNPRTVLRQTSNGLLEELFATLEIPIRVKWAEVGEKDIETIFDAYLALDDDHRQRAELVMHDLHSMTGESPQMVIRRQCHHDGEFEFAGELDACESRYDVALLTRLSKPSVWRAAKRFALADRVIGGRSSYRRIDVPTAEPQTSRERLNSLANAISAFYSSKQGRGRRCVTEYLQRDDGLHYVFASLDNYRQSVMKLVEGGDSFERVCQTQVFENVFVYDQPNDTIDVYAIGGKPVVQPLAMIFGREFMGIELPPEDPNAEPFALNKLLDPAFRFVTQPGDGVKEVLIESAEVQIYGPDDDLTFGPNSKYGRGGFQRMIDAYIRKDRAPRSNMNIKNVYFRFELENGHEFRFNIRRTNYNSLKSLATPDRRLAEKYLRIWGIDRASDGEAVSAA